MKRKRAFAMAAIVAMLFSTTVPFLGNSTAIAAGKPIAMSSPIEKMMQDNSVSLEFIEQELNKGYFISEIQQALDKHKKSGVTYESAMKSIHPLQASGTGHRGPVITEGPVIPKPTPKDPNKIFGKPKVSSKQPSSSSATSLTADSTTTTVDPNPVDLNATLKQAPYAVPDVNYSTLNGAVLGEYEDMAIAGKNGFGYTLRRMYDSSDAQMYDVNYGSTPPAMHTKYDQKTFMLGLGWRWAIPSIEHNLVDSNNYLHLADGGVYKMGTSSPYTLTGYQWKDLSLVSYTGAETDSTSGYKLMSTKDHVQYFFNSKKQLRTMKDPYGNTVKFTYGTSLIDTTTFKSTTSTTAGQYPLTKIETSNGNSMTITYCPQGATTALCTSTDQQIVIQSGNRSVVYQYAQYTYSTGNIMLLLTGVTQKVDDATTYQTQYSYWYYEAVSSNTQQKSNPYALLNRIVYPTGATSNFLYTKDTLASFATVSSSTITSHNEVYELMEMYKTLSNPGDSVNPKLYTGSKYNRVILEFNGKNMTTLDTDGTFSMTEYRNGIATSYKYLKSSYNKIPYYVLQSKVVDDGVTTTQTDNSYSQKNDANNTTVTTYPEPNLVTTTVTSKADSTQTAVFYNNTNYTDYGEIRDQAAPTTNATPNSNVQNTYDSTKRWLLTTMECLNSSETIASCTNKKVTTYTHDANTGAILSMTIQDAVSGKNLRQEQYVYAKDANGNITGNLLEKDAQDGTGKNLSVTTYTYDTANFLNGSSTGVTSNGTTQNVSKSYSFDPQMGTLKNITDGNGHKTSYTYDNIGRLTSVTYPNSDTATVKYDVNSSGNNNLIVTYSGLDPVTTQMMTKKVKYAWDTIGNKAGEFETNGTDASGQDIWMQQMGYLYDLNSRLTQQSDSAGVVTAYQNDNLGRQTKITYNYNQAGTNQLVESYQFDDVHLTQSHTDTESHIQQTKLDLFGNQIEQDLMDAGQLSQVLWKKAYNLASNVLTYTDGNGNQTQYQYDALSELLNVVTPDNVQTNYSYDVRGLEVSTNVSGDNSSAVTKSYDELGRLVQKTDGEGKVDHYTYDGSTNVLTHTDKKGQVTTFTYDARDRLTENAVDGDTINYAYDAQGRRASMTDGTGTTKYAYTYNDNLKQINLPDGLTESFQYDATDTVRVGLTDPFGQTMTYQKDALDRMTQVSLNGSTNPFEAQYTYSGSVVGTVKEGNNATFTSEYDSLNRLSTLSENVAGNLSTYGYSYDNNGNIKTKTDSVGSYSFTYDPQNRITKQSAGQSQEMYSYDLRGNRKTMSGNDNLPQIGKYDYDARNQLTTVTTADGQTVTYRYNGDGLLYERTDSKGTIRYYYDDNQNVIDDAIITSGQPTLHARYIRGENNQLIARQAPDGSLAYYTLNGHGDVTELRDSNGALLNSYYYDIWGKPTTTIEQVQNPFRYSGEYWDDTTNLQYLRARWYDPSQARFLIADTYEGDIKDPLSLNLYSYVQNNPLTKFDPSGHKSAYLSEGGADGAGGDGGGILLAFLRMIGVIGQDVTVEGETTTIMELDASTEETILGRPKYSQTEDLLEDISARIYGKDAMPQKSFLNGYDSYWGATNSSRPDVWIDNLNISIEAKNYTLMSRSYNLVSIIRDQAAQRAINLPKGALQTVFIDIRGQVLSNADKVSLLQKIQSVTTNNPVTVVFIK